MGVLAETESVDPSIKLVIDDIKQQTEEKQARLKELDALVSQYRRRVSEQEQMATTLENDVALLENRVLEKELAIQRIQELMEMINLNIQELGARLKQDEKIIERRSVVLGDVLRQIEETDRISILDTLLVEPSLSSFFRRVDELKRLQDEVQDATHLMKTAKAEREQKQKEFAAQRLELQKQSEQLASESEALERERAAKQSLARLTQGRQDEFQRILYELRQEQQSETDHLEALRDRLREQLNAADDALARGDVLLNWPLDRVKGVSAEFHDKTYPFRHLFEHPGIDLPTPVGTPIKAAAGGYVAWTRTGKSYGNYIMVIHPGNIATVYAHLSRFAVKPDSYVERGEVIGYSGGRAGDEGAGLSTGPHVHFEVRQNGIPVNPRGFLPDLD